MYPRDDERYPHENENPDAEVSTSAALRHLLVFQLKLAADALRDFLLSPLSIVAFLLDVLFKPRAKHSLYLRHMLLRRRSDRLLNLFDFHHDSGVFTVDRAVVSLEEAVRGANCANTEAADAQHGKT